MRIPMVFEPTFARDSIWCTEIKRGMTRVIHAQEIRGATDSRRALPHVRL